MDTTYLFFYLESMVVCIIIFGILLLHDLVQGDRQEKTASFDNVLLVHIMYFVCDGIWSSIIAGALPRTPFSVLLVNYLLLVLLGLLSETWFSFTAAVTKMPRRNTRRGRIMTALPMLVNDAVALIGCIAVPQYWVTPEGETTLLYYLFFVTIPIIYILSASLYAIIEAFKKENRLDRSLYLIVGIYPLTVVVAGLFQTLFLGAPIFCYSCTIMIILFNVINMESQISQDALTGLNNRGQIMRYAAQDSNLHKEGERTFVIMGDINDFKKINDTYGHAEGDHALIIVADALRRGAQYTDISLFLSRYGGDEFLMIAHVPERAEMPRVLAELIFDIRRALAEICKETNRPYVITMGFGYAEIMQGEDFETCMVRADERLYINKEEVKKGVTKSS